MEINFYITESSKKEGSKVLVNEKDVFLPLRRIYTVKMLQPLLNDFTHYIGSSRDKTIVSWVKIYIQFRLKS